MAYNKRLQLRYALKNPNAIILKFKKIFIYHYRYVHWQNPEPVPEHNLKQIGCSYVGWFDAGYDAVCELWKYPTKRHRILIEMSLPSNHVLWQEDWIKKIKKIKKENQQLDEYVRKLIKKTVLANRYIP